MGTCADCGIEYPYLQKAHIVARHKGGGNEPENIILICPNCHHLRDRDDRVAWIKAHWTPEEKARNSERVSRWFNDPANSEKVAERNRKISKRRTGMKYAPGKHPGGPKGRVVPEEERVRRAVAVKEAWEKKTPEEREAWRARCRSIKSSSSGNLENLKNGWDPEVHARAIEASARARQGKPQSEEANAKRSASLKIAYAEGRRRRGHIEETKRKIDQRD